MTKNPFLNALAAAVYIIFVASMMFYGPQYLGAQNKPDNVMAPIAFISLFTLSAAAMIYTFLYEPVRLALGGEKERAFSLFLQTVGIFAILTVVILGALVFSLR